MDLSKINNREKQAIGAISILFFCEKYLIYHKSIGELVEHLFEILISENLPKWDQDGLKMDIIGRGELLPEKVDEIIKPELKNDFFQLIEFVIEIGVVDLFGENTNYPNLFLKKAFDILKKHSITIKITETLFNSECEEAWGEKWDLEKYNDLKLLYKDMIKKQG